MPLFTMSSNVSPLDAGHRKRSHDEFFEAAGCASASPTKEVRFAFERSNGAEEKENQYNASQMDATTSAQKTPSTAKTESESSLFQFSSQPPAPTYNQNPVSVETPRSTQPSTSPVPEVRHDPAATPSPLSLDRGTSSAKKKRMTKEEKAAKDEELARKRQEREANKAAKAEKEASERQKKDAERAAKAAEKAKREAEKAEKEAEKRQRAEEKEREKREKEEQEARKARSQLKLNSFFKVNSAAAKDNPAAKVVTSGLEGTRPPGEPSKDIAKEVTLYEQMFKPFFVKEQVTLASVSIPMDEETREAKSRILDEYVNGDRQWVRLSPLNPFEAFQVPFCRARGRLHPRIREVMADLNGESSRPFNDRKAETGKSKALSASETLKTIPMKLLVFKEDVRPPYYGTITNVPCGLHGLRKLARKPLARDILPLNYDYDSEAEWQEEDGEDVDALDDDEEDLDNEEDMGDFLDDSEDTGPTRPAFSSGLEPESTGVCWENTERQSSLAELTLFRMEYILESLDDHASVNPFSNHYWDPAPPPLPCAPSTKQATAASGNPTASQPGSMAPPPVATDAFQALNHGTMAASSTSPPTGGAGAAVTKKTPARLAPDMQEKLKELVVANPALSRVGTVELFSSLHVKCSKASIKATLDLVAEKSGRFWRLKPGA
ncbi:hypothetical protein VTK73DRAFT_1584 [Phialemonium thermophilum]|uniref:Chromatin assembly factor 1 subunit A dimerization domain-containing protein n=1 Tax=Phialemonium thermophilum TaxID=223376 RepID=A0ABR3Y4E0_9PEZI